MIELEASSTALVLIDLQNGIVRMPVAPRTGAEVVTTAKALAARFRSAKAKVALVSVGWAEDFGDALSQWVDQPPARPAGGMPKGWSDLAEGLAAPGDLRIFKRQWGAFYGTDLELQLRRRAVRTIALGGIATNFGVESTARQAWELGFGVVVVEDACATLTRELHDIAVKTIFPRIARVTTSDRVMLV